MSGAIHTVILAGGYGTRLRPITARRPKPLVPIAGEPLVGRQLGWLHQAGIRRVRLATSYLAEQFVHDLADGSRFGVRLDYATEMTPLGTGGAVRNALLDTRFEDDDLVLIVNGDQLTHHDLLAQIRHHREHSPGLSMHCRKVPDARNFGLVDTDASGRINAFREKPRELIGGLVNAGTYVLNPVVLQRIRPGEVCSLERDVFPKLAAQGLLSAYIEDAYCLDVGTPDALVQANVDQVRSTWGERFVDPSAHVNDSAIVMGGSWIGPEVDIAPGAVVDASVLMAGARVETGGVVRRSVLSPGSSVACDAQLVDGALGDDERWGG